MAKKKKKRTRNQRRPQTRPLSTQPQKKPAPATERRVAFEKRSAGPLLLLHRLPRWLLPVITGILLLLGIALPYAWAGIFLIALGGLMGWLLSISWPVLMPGPRYFRLFTVLIITAAGFVRIFGWA